MNGLVKWVGGLFAVALIVMPIYAAKTPLENFNGYVQLENTSKFTVIFKTDYTSCISRSTTAGGNYKLTPNTKSPIKFIEVNTTSPSCWGNAAKFNYKIWRINADKSQTYLGWIEYVTNIDIDQDFGVNTHLKEGYTGEVSSMPGGNRYTLTCAKLPCSKK